jgi:hypothetical protein
MNREALRRSRREPRFAAARAADLRIAANDSTLAHIAAGRGMQAEVGRWLSRAASVCTSFPKIMRDLGPWVICSSVKRPIGSRQMWWVLVMVATSRGYVAVLLDRKGGQSMRMAPVASVTSHAVARFMQRTLNSGDVQAVREALKPVLLGLWNFVYERHFYEHPPEGTTIKIITGDGALLGEWADGYVQFRTWVSAATCSDHAIRASAARVAKMPDHVIINVRSAA